MTDKDKVIALLTDLGIGFEVREYEVNKEGGTEIVCEVGMDKVDGYSCFYTVFAFDKDSKIKTMGAWE